MLLLSSCGLHLSRWDLLVLSNHKYYTQFHDVVQSTPCLNLHTRLLGSFALLRSPQPAMVLRTSTVSAFPLPPRAARRIRRATHAEGPSARPGIPRQSSRPIVCSQPATPAPNDRQQMDKKSQAHRTLRMRSLLHQRLTPVVFEVGRARD